MKQNQGRRDRDRLEREARELREEEENQRYLARANLRGGGGEPIKNQQGGIVADLHLLKDADGNPTGAAPDVITQHQRQLKMADPLRDPRAQPRYGGFAPRNPPATRGVTGASRASGGGGGGGGGGYGGYGGGGGDPPGRQPFMGGLAGMHRGDSMRVELNEREMVRGADSTAPHCAAATVMRQRRVPLRNACRCATPAAAQRLPLRNACRCATPAAATSSRRPSQARRKYTEELEAQIAERKAAKVSRRANSRPAPSVAARASYCCVCLLCMRGRASTRCASTRRASTHPPCVAGTRGGGGG